MTVYSNARCEPTYVELSTCDHTRCMLMPGITSLGVAKLGLDTGCLGEGFSKCQYGQYAGPCLPHLSPALVKDKLLIPVSVDRPLSFFAWKNPAFHQSRSVFQTQLVHTALHLGGTHVSKLTLQFVRLSASFVKTLSRLGESTSIGLIVVLIVLSWLAWFSGGCVIDAQELSPSVINQNWNGSRAHTFADCLLLKTHLR